MQTSRRMPDEQAPGAASQASGVASQSPGAASQAPSAASQSPSARTRAPGASAAWHAPGLSYHQAPGALPSCYALGPSYHQAPSARGVSGYLNAEMLLSLQFLALVPLHVSEKTNDLDV
jgi:hypothetical protein